MTSSKWTPGKKSFADVLKDNNSTESGTIVRSPSPRRAYFINAHVESRPEASAESCLTEKDRIIRAVSKSSYFEVVGGKKKWFSWDGRPLNSKGLPTFTEEERQALTSTEVKVKVVPDISRDRWGRRYEDYGDMR